MLSYSHHSVTVSVISTVGSGDFSCGTCARSATWNSTTELGGVADGTSGEATSFKHNSHAATRWWWRERSRSCCQDKKQLRLTFRDTFNKDKTILIAHPFALIVRFQCRIMGLHQPHIKRWHVGCSHVRAQEIVRQCKGARCTLCTVIIQFWFEFNATILRMFCAQSSQWLTKTSYQTAKFENFTSGKACEHKIIPSSRNSCRMALSLSCLRKKISWCDEATAETLRTSRGMDPSCWFSAISVNHSHSECPNYFLADSYS